MLKKTDKKTESLSAHGLRFGIIAAEYNAKLVEALLESTLAELKKAEALDVRIVRVPGSYDVPVIAAQMAHSKKYDSLIALGVILEGKTSHAEHIAIASSINLQRSSIESGIPIVHQILTPRNVRDAKERVAIRGQEAARTAIKMAHVVKGL